jgi:hypothetical protein
MSTSAARRGWSAGITSRIWTVAMPNQPIARHQYSCDRPVTGSAQLCARFSSYACFISPLACCRWEA